MRIAVLAEGAGELGTLLSTRAPAHTIAAEQLGPAHVLISRCLQTDRGLHEREIEFVEPLRVRGRIARGSDLLNARTLRQLLVWPMAERQPDLQVVLVDQNGEARRRARLQTSIEGLVVPELVIGVANKEFEAWLVGDEEAVRECVGEGFSIPGNLEDMERRAAKNKLLGLIRSSSRASEESVVRREIAEQLDLDRTASRCPLFRKFRDDLRNPPPAG